MAKTERKNKNEIGHDFEAKRLTDDTGQTMELEVKLVPKRWFNLIIFIFFTTSHCIQWGQFTVVANITARYFNVSEYAIAWTAFVTNVLFVILLYPLNYLVYKIDLRRTCLLASVTAVIASWIKVFALSPDNFLAMFIAQIMIGFWQVTVMSVPTLFAAYWFGSQEISLATSLSTIGIPIGIAILFCMTPMYVRNHENIDDITNDLHAVFLTIAIFCTFSTIAMLFFFENEPELPPSKSRALQRLYKRQNFGFWTSVKRIVMDRNFLIISNSVGLNMAVNTNVITLMNIIYVPHFENGERDAGLLTFILIIVGLVGSVVVSKIQDEIKKFKQLSLFLYYFALVSEILFAVSLYMNSKWAVFTSTAFLGFALVSFMTTGVETMVEAVYPESEAVCTAIGGVLNQIYGVVLLLISHKLTEFVGDMSIHSGFIAALIIGLILMHLASDIHKRQDAIKIATLNELNK